jgi:hypothetical protein
VLRIRLEPHIARDRCPETLLLLRVAAGRDRHEDVEGRARKVVDQLLRSLASAPEVRELIDNVRETTSARILEGLFPDGPAPPKARAAVKGWLWYMDGVLLDWIEHRDMSRLEVRDLLLGTLGGALAAAAQG